MKEHNKEFKNKFNNPYSRVLIMLVEIFFYVHE